MVEQPKKRGRKPKPKTEIEFLAEILKQIKELNQLVSDIRYGRRP